MSGKQIGLILLGIGILLCVGIKLASRLTEIPPTRAAVLPDMPEEAPAPRVKVPTTREAEAPRGVIRNPFRVETKGESVNVNPGTWQRLDSPRAWLAKANAGILRMTSNQGPAYPYLIEGYIRCGERGGLNEVLAAAQRVLEQDERGWAEQARIAGLRVHIGEGEVASASVDSSSDPLLRIYGHMFIARAFREHEDFAGFGRELRRAITAAGNAEKSQAVEAAVEIAKIAAETMNNEVAFHAADLLKGGGRFSYAGSQLDVARFHRDALVEIARARIKLQDLDTARSAYHTATTPEARDLVQSVIAEGRGKTDLINSAVASITYIKSPANQHPAWVALGAAYVRRGNMNKAREAFGEARRIASQLPRDQFGLREDANLAGTLAECGDFESASKMLQEIPSGVVHDIAAARIGLAHGRRGDLEQAHAVLTRIGDNREGIDAVREVAVLEARAGRFEEAVALAKRQGREINGMYTVTYPLYDTIGAVFREAVLARTPIETMEKTISRLDQEQERIVACVGIARGMNESLASTGKKRVETGSGTARTATNP